MLPGAKKKASAFFEINPSPCGISREVMIVCENDDDGGSLEYSFKIIRLPTWNNTIVLIFRNDSAFSPSASVLKRIFFLLWGESWDESVNLKEFL